MSDYQRIYTTTGDGVRLALTRFEPDPPRRAVLVCTHAMMANSSYFRRGRFAQYLASCGIEVYLLDWRGHGKSVPPSPRRDSWGFEEYVQYDLPAALGCAADTAAVGVDELCYLGHSLGGLAGLAAFGSGVVPQPRRLSLWAASVWLPGRDGSLKRRLTMKLYQVAARPLGYAPVRRLRFGSDDEPRQYVDQLAHWAYTGAWIGRDGTDYMAGLASITTPTLPFLGDGDPICFPPDANTLALRLANAQPLRYRQPPRRRLRPGPLQSIHRPPRPPSLAPTRRLPDRGTGYLLGPDPERRRRRDRALERLGDRP